MDEKEALKRQIELLQNLINNHKSVHGNAPSTSADPWRPPRPASAGIRGQNMLSSLPHRLHVPLPATHWKKTYSLSNKTQQESEGQPLSSSSTGFTSKLLQESRKPQSTSLPNRNIDLSSTDCGGSQNLMADAGGLVSYVATTGVRTLADSGSTAFFMKARKSRGEGIAVSMMGLSGMGRERDTHKAEDVPLSVVGNSADVPVLKTTSENKGLARTSSYARLHSSGQLQIRPRLSLTGATNEKQTVTMATSSNPTSSNDTATFVIASSVVPQQTIPSPKPKPNPSKLLFASSTRQSKFTWVKSHSKDGAGTSQTRAEPQTRSSSPPIPACPAGTPGNASTPLSSKRALHKKVPRRLSLSTGASKTSKYTWVSSSAGGQTKLPRKPLSPKALALPHRTLEKGDAVKKAKMPPSASAKHRKGTGASTLSSRYSWKAGGQIGSGVGAGTAVLRRRSAFHWTSEGAQKGPKREKECLSLLSVSQPSSSPGGFKLRSRMKIVRRCASSGAVSERRTSPSSLTVSSRYSLRRRTHTPTRTHTQSKSPGAAKKTQARELVAFGRHKLRRLSPNSHRTGPASPSPRGPASQKVFRTRYKMVTRLAGAAAHGPHYSGPLSWRAKRIQSARNVLQGRLRAPHDRHPPVQHWRGRDMRWIGGSWYRVSANKLSRTVAASTSINRTGKWFGPHEVSPAASPSLARPSSSRHVASRAVQRSLAIIRHARQKKPQKQYCMYYNRFGKCNRGDSCPYIHDPDKVAVCTRFLRGTCKQTDGTCPFSHKVAKEKMPVCSYFLRGICNNSSCPYSHVYVSRKAAVCQDFLKGYCPQGEKCKKKHTLVCPDFSASGSCPRGSQCKLRHRQRAKHAAPHPPSSSSCSSSSSSSSGGPAKRSHRTKRPRLCVVMPSEQTEAPEADPGTPASGPLKLPSFISLSSSPEDADAPDTPPAPAEVTERKLQIKPRL